MMDQYMHDIESKKWIELSLVAEKVELLEKDDATTCLSDPQYSDVQAAW